MKDSKYRLFYRLSFSFLLLLCLAMLSSCAIELITPIQSTEPHDHEWTGWENASLPTCTEEGKEIRLCACGATELRPVAALGHTEAIDPAVAPTCTESGLTEGSHCSVCNTVLVEQKTLDASGHSLVVDAPLKETCTESGLTAGVHCSICEAVLVQQETIAAKGHVEESIPAKEATCTEAGLTEGMRCSVCEALLVKQEAIDAKGHRFSEWKTVKEASCTERGEQKRVCDCGHSETATIEFREHTIVASEPKAATCTEPGITTEVSCSVCKKVFVKSETIAAKGHSYSSKVTQPTCTERGFTTYLCTCGDSYIDSYTEAIGHDEVIDLAVSPTCTEAGLSAGSHCSICKEILIAQIKIKAKGHTETITPSKAATCTEPGLTTGVFCSICDEILIAQETIEAKGHSYSAKITPPTCTESGFTTYTCLCGDVYVDDHTKPTHPNADRDSICDLCGSVIPGLYDSSDRIIVSWNELKTLFGMDAGKTYSSESYATDPASPYYILTHDPALAAISEFKLILPDGEDVGDYAFFGCERLIAVDLRNAERIGTRSFSGCSNLTSIRADAENPRYRAEGNCLIDKATGELVLGCRSSIIPERVLAIADSAFFGSGITSIVIPESVLAIGSHAFYACGDLDAVYFVGEADAWTAATSDAIDPLPSSATVYFYSAELPTSNGSFWHFVDGTPAKHPPLGTKNYTFGAFSDVHFAYGSVAEKNFERALAYLAEKEKVDFACVAGDLTGNGTIEEYERYKQLVDRIAPSFPLYEVTGNHDVETFTGTTELVKPYFGEELYYSFTRGDDVYIMFGIQGWKTAETFSAESLQWLYETLEANRNKRCFVFQHCPRFDGSGVPIREPAITANMLTTASGQVFLSLMEHYKNVIWFHGHTHMNLKYQEVCSYFRYDRMFGCHSVHVPSLASGRKLNDAGTGFVNVYTESEGYVIDVYDNHIVLRGHSFAYTGVSPLVSFTIDTTLTTIEANTYTDASGTIRP